MRYIEVNWGNGITEIVPMRRVLRMVKDILLTLSVAVPNIFGLMFILVLFKHPAVCVIYWAITYGWTLLFLYANCRKKDRPVGKRKRSY